MILRALPGTWAEIVLREQRSFLALTVGRDMEIQEKEALVEQAAQGRNHTLLRHDRAG
jgi:hypothetical protein